MRAPIKEGREILTRVLDALLDSPDCYFPFRGAPAITANQSDNWHARQTVSKLLREGSVDLETDAPQVEAILVPAVALPVDVDAMPLDELERLTAPVQAGLF